MTRNELERYLGKCVTITLLDNTVIEGALHKTGEKAFENNPNLSIPVNFYFCTDVNNKVVKNTAFRVSHIQRISCYEKLRMTNFEKIKQMSVENMAEMLLDESKKHFTYCNHCSHQSFYAPHCTSSNLRIDCIHAVKKWLESEVDMD